MSSTAVRDYFRNRLDGLGYSEWTDGFDFENIPESIIDRSYHLEVGTLTNNGSNFTINDFSYPVLVRIYLKGYNDPALAIDDSVSQGEAIRCDITKVTNSNTQSIKGVLFDSMVPVAKDETNDNIILLDMQFTARIIEDRR